MPSLLPFSNLHLVHAIRLAVLTCLLLLLPSPHGQSIGEQLVFGRTNTSEADDLTPPSVEAIVACADQLPKTSDLFADGEAHVRFQVAENANERGLFELQDENGSTMGWAARTLPQAQDVLGYRGPTEALLLMNPDQVIVGIDILTSHDTEEHVDEVRRSPAFFDQFVGLTWGGKNALDAADDPPRLVIDGVSGATLTSLAMARGVLKRLGNETRSLIFDRPLNLDDAKALFPDALEIRGDPVAVVLGASADSSANNSIPMDPDQPGPEERLGTIVRTGGLVDDEIGYQGPTEMLLGFDTNGKLLRPALRSSFDNEPYVGYIPQEYSFWPPFVGKTLPELATMDVQAEGVEGVSGATMTSMAIAYSLPRVAAKIQAAGGLEAWTRPPTPLGLTDRISQLIEQIRWTNADTVTVGLLALLLLLTSTHQMRRKPVRYLWLLGVTIGIGIWTGNLVSLALIAGWVTSGVSWYLAIGLVLLVAVAMIVPPTRRGNPYCNHLCPHGALQQLIRPKSHSRRKWNLPIHWQKRMARAPALILAVAYLMLLFRPRTDVSLLEPFHAYLWAIASWSTIAFALLTLGFSASVPMGYCRFGCPTGRLLEHIRLKTSGAKWGRFDVGVLVLLSLALAKRLLIN